MRRSAIIACLGMAIHSATASASIIDQKLEPPIRTGSAQSYIGGPGLEKSTQVVTVGRTGQFTGVDLYIFSLALSQPLLIDVRTAPGGVPSEGDVGPHILASAAVSRSQVPDVSLLPGLPFTLDSWGGPWLHVDLPDFAVAAGDQIAITARTNDAQHYWWMMPSSYPGSGPAYSYAGGNTWYSEDGGPWISGHLGHDAVFRTYVTPEPTLAAMLAPLMGLLIRRPRT